MNLAFEAMQFARHVHRKQRRTFTGNPYSDHLAEVAGIAATVDLRQFDVIPGVFIATAWLHDCMEDQDVTEKDLRTRFGSQSLIAGVRLLSDFETGTRAERKAATCARLAQAPGWVQTIKCADIISNTGSAAIHDPEYAKVYFAEKRELLTVLTKADHELWKVAMTQVSV